MTNQKHKPRILVCSESSKVSSGFGTYNKALLKGLFESNKYEIAEFASYGLIGDKEKFNIPWKYYPNAIEKDDKREQLYNSSPENQFGKWRFDRVVLDFKPEIVIDIRDYWMSAYQRFSPLRKYFHWILMPTIDSFPQKEEWLDTYINANAIFTYSDWGAEVLKQQTSNKIKYISTASPAANASSYQQVSLAQKQEIKGSLALSKDNIVIGTVMRNQKRKLFPELIQAFEALVDRLRNEQSEKSNQVILYLHTSYPDAGWDMFELIKNSKVSNKIYFTYWCRSCNAIFASNLAGFTQKCYKCKQKSAIIPNVGNAIGEAALGKIMSIFDVYVQYSICEGFGMPQVEASYCGVPVLTVNYSAMEDMIKKINAQPIKLGLKFKELETGAIRVYPDKDDTVDKLYSLIHKPQNILAKIGFTNKNLATNEYSWQDTVQKWMDYIDTVDTDYYRSRWENMSYQQIPTININPEIRDKTVYEQIYSLHNQFKSTGLDMSTYWLLKNIYFAQNSMLYDGASVVSYSINNIIKDINSIITNYNNVEYARCNPSLLTSEDFIDYANKTT